MALNSWLVSMAASTKVLPGDTLQLAPNTCYKVSSTIFIKNFMGAHSNITFDGNYGSGTRLRSFNDALGGDPPTPDWTMNTAAPHVQIEGNQSLTVENLRILGSATGGYNMARALQPGFSLLGGNADSFLENNVVDDVWGDYVFVQRDGSSGHYNLPNFVTIQNNRFGTYYPNVGAGRHQLTIDDANTVDVTGNIFGGISGLDSIDLEPPAPDDVISNVTIENNTFGPGRQTPGYWFGNDGYPATISNLNVDFNTVHRAMNVNSADTSAGGGLPSPPNRTNYSFEGNTSDANFAVSAGTSCADSQAALMNIQGVDGVELVANTQPMQVTGSGGPGCPRLLNGTYIDRGTIMSNTLANATRVATLNTPNAACEFNNYIGPGAHTLAGIDPNAYAC